MFPVTTFFAALSAFMLVALSVNVIRTRQRTRTIIGDGGNEIMQRATRAQANFSEYVPMALIMMALLEAAGTRSWVLVVLGLLLLAGRASHAYSLLVHEVKYEGASLNERIKFRKAGMIATFFVIVVEGLLLLA
ncbi:MAG: MAPEG family protein [Alphaproteobacteria bacterium]|nr:MAPEG family protein [Alphaproteobacteria bacterium]